MADQTVDSILDRWHKHPTAEPTMRSKLLAELLLYTEGTVFISWTTYDIVSANLGAGIYKVRLVPRRV